MDSLRSCPSATSTSTTGEVVAYDHRGADWPVIAPSFGEFLTHIRIAVRVGASAAPRTGQQLVEPAVNNPARVGQSNSAGEGVDRVRRRRDRRGYILTRATCEYSAS